MTKECDDMKKTIGMTALLFLMMGLIGCNGESANIDFPFEVGDIENIEIITMQEYLHQRKRK